MRSVEVFKRMVDILGGSLAVLFCGPLILGISTAIWISIGRPIVFRQTRPGLHGEPFVIYKFRTMSDKRDREGKLAPDEERMTAIGNFLRRTSLDELPELWNVVKGDMSLVGPRPLLMEYLDLYTPEQARRHEVKPGLTGWAQVKGRNAISWEEKFALDVWYVDHRSLALDLKILGMTIIKVLRREGIAPEGKVTMEKFSGSGR